MTKPMEDYHFVSQLHKYESNEELEAKLEADNLAFMRENKVRRKKSNTHQKRKNRRDKIRFRRNEYKELKKNGRNGRTRSCYLSKSDNGKKYLVRYYDPRIKKFFKNQANRKVRRTPVHEDIPHYKKMYSIEDELY